MRQSSFTPAERMTERYNIEPNVLDDLKQVILIISCVAAQLGVTDALSRLKGFKITTRGNGSTDECFKRRFSRSTSFRKRCQALKLLVLYCLKPVYGYLLYSKIIHAYISKIYFSDLNCVNFFHQRKTLSYLDCLSRNMMFNENFASSRYKKFSFKQNYIGYAMYSSIHSLIFGRSKIIDLYFWAV